MKLALSIIANLPWDRLTSEEFHEAHPSIMYAVQVTFDDVKAYMEKEGRPATTIANILSTGRAFTYQLHRIRTAPNMLTTRVADALYASFLLTYENPMTAQGYLRAYIQILNHWAPVPSVPERSILLRMLHSMRQNVTVQRVAFAHPRWQRQQEDV